MKDDRQGPDIDRILRALAEQDADDGLPAPGDERLLAWREGRLPAGEVRELEEILGRSAAGRRRLLELSGITDIDRSLPLRRVRKAVLDQAGRPVRRRVAPRYAAAMAVAATIVLALAGILSRHRALPEGLAYDVSARGLAEARSVEEAPTGGVRAYPRLYPDTTLRILVRPQGDSPAGVSFALFRREGGILRRVREPDEVRLETERGSAAFSGAAARVLATRVPGEYSLFAVVARETLPSSIELKPGQAPEAALKDSGRLVYPVKVILLRAEEGSR